MDAIAALDMWLFGAINNGLASGPLDFFMLPLTNRYIIMAVMVAAAVVVFVKGGGNVRWMVVMCAVAFVLGDVVVFVLKNIVMRVRPCHVLTLDTLRVLAECGDFYSFPSRHTTGLFSITVLLGTRFRRYAPLFLAPAFVVGFSRVYAGMHYPTDVLAGAITGTVIAFAVYLLDRKYSERYLGGIKCKIGGS